jgi:uncharacterized repeat protein (TIGR01451 family)
MNKNYLKALLAVICLLKFTNTKAQAGFYTSGTMTVNVMPAMLHDSTVCSSTCHVTYLITVGSSFVGDSVKIIDTATHSLIYGARNISGASPWTLSAPAMIYNSSLSDDNVSGGIVAFFGPVAKVVCDTDTIHAITNVYVLPVSNPCLYGNVSGMAYVDNNSNCIYDAGDVPLNSLLVNSVASLFSPLVSSNYRNTWTGGGLYNMKVQRSWMTSYSVYLPTSYYFIFPPTPCFAGAYSFTTLPQTGVDFPLQCTGNDDIMVWAGSEPDVRVNTPFHMLPYVSNTGCDTISGVLTFVKDSRVIYNPGLSTIPATYVSGDTLQWNYTQLTNLSSGAYWNSFVSHIHLTPDTSVHAGDILCFRIYTAVPSTDIDPTNNDQTICLPVVYSYDPNQKEVSPTGTGTAGFIPDTTHELTYTLHFQNTGTAVAYNIQITDTLDSHLNAGSLKILGSSHTMVPEWLAPGVVRFNYYGILLPDSTHDEAASHGFVRFSVKPNTGLAPGTQIKNKGYIYFDANPPVLTNTVLNTIQATGPTKTPKIAVNMVKVYPNPASDQVFVENLQGGTITIMNVSGTVVVEQDINANKAVIDISRLANGVYILKAVSKDNSTTTKLIKQ